MTGSGVTLDELVRQADRAGWEQQVVCGVPADRPEPEVADLEPERIHPLVFGRGRLDFPLPGMSDVMPYPSTCFSSMTPGMLHEYRAAWCEHLVPLIERFRPDVIHAHHVWLLGSWIKDLAPGVPVLNHCHATGLRQMDLCPHLTDEVRRGCARNERFGVLLRLHADELSRTLGVEPERVRVVGAGYRSDLFHARGADSARGRRLVYVGKYSAAKGLPWLLSAVERLAPALPGLELHVAGSGAGDEAERLHARMRAMAPTVVLHGQLEQPSLAELMRTCAVFVLPSFYEGLGLVLVEALACGCRLVATALPGVEEALVPHLGQALQKVAMPRMIGIDVPDERDLPTFVARLAEAIEAALSAGPLGDPARVLPGALEPFTWQAVYGRVEAIWRELNPEELS